MMTSTHARRPATVAVAPASPKPAKRESPGRRGRQREQTRPPQEEFDDAVPGSLFQDREAPPESAQVEGAIDDWPEIDGTVDDVPAEPVESGRHR